MQFDSEKLVSGSSDNTLKVWCMLTGDLKYTMQQHQAPVWNLKFDGSKIISTAFDQRVLVWNFGGLEMLSHEQTVQWGLVDDDRYSDE